MKINSAASAHYPHWLKHFFLIATLLAVTGEAPAQDNPPAAADTLPAVVDLKPFYSHPFVTGQHTNTMTYLSVLGRHTYDGLPFDIDGRLVMDGQNDHGLPAVSGIKIGRKFAELHLIHTAQWHEYQGCAIALIRLHYADGTSHDFELQYAVQVTANRLPSESREVLTDRNSKLIWRAPGPFGGSLRLIKTVLNNPFPEKEVVTMDVISTHTRASYVLLAATVANQDAHRAVTPALPLNDPDYHFDGAVKVQVVDADSGAAIAGADVYPYMSVENVGLVAPPMLTDTNGVAVVEYPVSRTDHLGVEVSKSGYSGKRGNWQQDNIPKAITYRLAAAKASIQGVVVDAADQPVAGATVRFNSYNFGEARDEQVYLPHTTTQTDTTGHWTIAGLPTGYQNFSVTVTHPDFPQAQFYADGLHQRGFQGPHVPTADFLSGKAVLKLTVGNKLSGQVSDTTGKPVAGAAIFVGFDRYMSGAIKATTDAQGAFSLKNLGSGENYLTLSAPGLAPKFLTLTLTGSNAPLQVVMEPGKIIHGRVVDQAGKPIQDASISFEGLANQTGTFGGRTIEWQTKTDAQGEFFWHAAPVEPVKLSIHKAGYMALEWITVQTDSADLKTFSLNGPLIVQGAVVDEDTGAPIAKFTITPGWPQGNGGMQREGRRASSGKDGHYEVSYEAPIIISTPPSDFMFQISAPGYAPVQSRAIKPDEGTVTWNVKLKKMPATIITVKTADGKPVPGVKVWLAGLQDYLQLNDTNIFSQGREIETFETDAEGLVAVPPQPEQGGFSLVAASPVGFAAVSLAQITNHSVMTLQAWGRVTGTLTKNGAPMAGHELYFFVGDGTTRQNLGTQTPAPVDAEGHFTFPHVPAGTIRVELKQPMGERSWSYKELQTVDVKPGEETVVKIAVTGRDVVGRWRRDAGLAGDVVLEQGNFYLRPDVGAPPIPKDLDSPEKMQSWYQTWSKTEAGKKFVAAQRQMAQLQMKPDGTLHGETVAPGKYILSGNFWGRAGQVAEVDSREVVIPEGSPDAPFDLGEIVIKAVKQLKVGDVAPEFSVKTLDDQPLKLSDFRGKYVLLDFWATWCGPCVAETPHLKAAFDAYGSDARFVMISLSLDQNAALPKKFAQSHDLKWQQGFLGEWSKDTVTKDYCVRGIPSIFLVGPDGKIIATNLRGDGIKSAVGSALGAKPQ